MREIRWLPFNSFDMAGITNAVSDAKADRMVADFDISQKNVGIVRIIVNNWHTNDGSIVILEIHKLARPGFFRQKAWWVVQLYSRADPNSAIVKHGCVSANLMAFALHQAKVDVMHNFLSIADFQLAATSWA